MNSREEKELVYKTVVLIVPKQHVKAVKVALEQSSIFDRTSKISLAIQQQEGSYISATSEGLKERSTALDAGDPQRNTATSVPEALPALPATSVRFPVLKFDVVSGQYVDPAVLEERRNLHTTYEFPALKFDVVSGEYVDPKVLEERNNPEAASQSSHLKFDATTGQYTDPEPNPQFPTLKFDVATGEYVDPSILEQRKQFDAGIKEQRMKVPTTVQYNLNEEEADDTSRAQHDQELKSKLLEDLNLSHLYQDISISYQILRSSEITPTANRNPLHRALNDALNTAWDDTLTSLDLTTDLLVSSFPEAYSIYKPMLLLPNNAFSSEPWTKLLSTHPLSSDLLQSVWKHIAEALDATHIAINSPIPLQTSTSQAQDDANVENQENILRSPVNITPIYGDFGPSPTRQTLSSPTSSDFASALWVSTTQNGIHQTWAPLYTMFSRGNIREKTRILNLPSVTSDFGVPSTAVDLYAGIGYFAFSYKKGGAGRKNGIERVLCWELNPWSVEGLRRGAEMNGWTSRIIKQEDVPTTDAEWKPWVSALVNSGETGKREDFWIFQMSNEYALSVIQHLDSSEPTLKLSIRHVNLGLLPHSLLSWRSAVRILDPDREGWIHAHENVGIHEIDLRRGAVEKEFQRLLDEFDGEAKAGENVSRSTRRAIVEHVERVKMYAPGVVHLVFDIRVST